MDPVLKRVEVLMAVVGVDDDLAIDDVATDGEAELWEIPAQGLPAPRLNENVLAVDEDDRAETVELRLVRPLVAERQLLSRAGELGRDGRLERQRHGGAMVAAGRAPVGSAGMAEDRTTTAAEQEYLE